MPRLMQRLMIGAGLVAAGLMLSACGPSEPKAAGAAPDMRRLTDGQYRNIIADVFGPNISVAGRADPLIRTEGLLALSARTARITPAGFQQYYSLARSISAQVVSPENRGMLVPCTPASATAADDACAKTFYSKVGRLLYRRPVEEAELNTAVKAANDAAIATNDFYRGLAAGLTGMMVTPKFLFVVDTTEPDPDNRGAERLTAYAKAARLSFLLWNTTPDETLLAAAEKGELHTKAGLERQVERMITSHRLDKGVRAFFTDFLMFEKFDTLEKDTIVYPVFSVTVADHAKEQVLRTITDHLVVQNKDYRDLFTTRKTFLSAPLSRVYRVPISRPDGLWVPYEFAADDPRAGIVTQIGFVALSSHPGRSSPTLRGKAIREALLCQHVPDPPGDVDFAQFEDPNSPNKTARERLTAHSTVAACAGCHKITDPIGLALENFDGVGQFRTTEGGAPIDTSGDLDGVTYKDALGLGQALRDNPGTPACLVDRMAAYGLGRPIAPSDGEFVEYLQKSFVSDKYQFTKLLQRIALSDALYAVTAKPAGTTQSASQTPANPGNS